MPYPIVLNWSSGKDATLACLELLRHQDYEVCELLTTINAEADRVFMHGTRESVLDQQAALMGLPLRKLKLPPAPTDAVYEDAMSEAFRELRSAGVRHAAYGDIFLDDLRAYREAQLAAAGFEGVFPLWKRDTTGLVHELEATGIQAIIVCVNAAVLDASFLGRTVNAALLQDLPAGVDPCGENGEYHTCVVEAPFFSKKLRYEVGETVYRSYGEAGFYFLDLID
jgi:uncharacterized protein (TIGR00290 family)